MEINTCEQYVLRELETYRDRADHFEKEAKRIADEAHDKIGEFKKAIDYGNKVIGLLAQLNGIGYVDLKNEDGSTTKTLCISPQQGIIKLDMEKENDKYIYELLAPILGDEEVKKEFEAKRAEADGEKKEEKVEEK
jgi:hypothetical protein